MKATGCSSSPGRARSSGAGCLTRPLPSSVEARFTVEAVLGVEGPGWALPDLAARWADPARRAEILAAARAVESEPSLLGFHAHILAVGRVATGSN